jgi:hypothetical protein
LGFFGGWKRLLMMVMMVAQKHRLVPIPSLLTVGLKPAVSLSVELRG